MNFSECRLAASGSAAPGVAIVYRSQASSPGVAASFGRPGAKLAAEQGNLAGVITVMEAASCGPPRLGSRATLGGRIRVRRPAFDCFVRVRSILSRNFAKVVVHPIA